MAKQPVKKKNIKKNAIVDRKSFLEKYKTNHNLNGIKDKELEWIVLPEAFHDAIKIPGIPKGFVSLVRGLPNTGKSTLKLCLIAQCQREGILPVIYETENNFPWDHARDCGVEFDEVREMVTREVVNEETGEIEEITAEEVVDHTGFFLFFDSDTLYQQYGKMDYSQGKEMNKPTRKYAVLDDIAYSMNLLMDQQEDGELPYELCFIWDSVGSLPSYRSAVSNTSNNMWDAGAIATAFNNIMNNRIPISRKISREFTNTFLVINKIWIDSMGFGAPQVKNKGGESFAYGSRLIIHLGGIVSAGVEKLKATSRGETYYYGIQTRIRIEKNQVNDITYEGKICSLPHGLWTPSKLDEYKKANMKYLMNRLSEIGGTEVKEDEIEFGVEEEDGKVKNTTKKN